MAWGNTADESVFYDLQGTTRDAAQSYYGDNYKGTAYGSNPRYTDPGITGRPSWSDFDYNRSQGYDRSGPSTGVRQGPSYHDRLTGKFDSVGPGARVGIASIPDEKEKMGIIGHTKQALSGMKWPNLPGYAGMMFDSIAKNQAQHKDLDQYFQSQDPGNWRNMKNATFFGEQGFDTGNLTRQGAQARGYFNRAGITDQVLAKFMNPSYKFGGNEAWLRAQADGDKSELVDQGLSFIKNAKDTSRLHGSIMRGPAQDAAEAGMVEPGIEGRPDWDTFDSEMVEPGIPGRPAWDTFDERYFANPGGFDEDITDFRSGIAQEGGAQSLAPPGGWLDVSENIGEWEKPSWLKNLGSYGFGMPGYYEHDYTDKYDWGLDNPELEYLTDPEEYYKDLRNNYRLHPLHQIR